MRLVMSENSFGDLLSEEIAKQGTVRGLAKHAGLSHEIVRQYCQGNKLPSAKSFTKLLAALRPIPGAVEECLAAALSMERRKRRRTPTKKEEQPQASESPLTRRVRLLTEFLLEEVGAEASVENYERYRRKILNVLELTRGNTCTGTPDHDTQQSERRRRLRRNSRTGS